MTYVRKVPAQHYCRPPEVFGTHDDWEDPVRTGKGGAFGLRAPQLKPGRRLPHVGDIWECDGCGCWWELRTSPYENVLAPEWVKKWRPWWRRK